MCKKVENSPKYWNNLKSLKIELYEEILLKVYSWNENLMCINISTSSPLQKDWHFQIQNLRNKFNSRRKFEDSY